LTDTVKALELSGALKNVYAIACGLAEGMGFGMNTRAKLIVLAIEEMQALFTVLGLSTNTDMLAGTIGDLFLTCSSANSRNFLFGKLLAEYSPTQVLEKIGATVEGYFTAASVSYFQEKGAALPLAGFVSKITTTPEQNPVDELFREFLRKV
jgi:glycerol-3-phosphate dehydrogenase (NAD(P)+)